jgi:diguanylate cyclase (GGDEF)-like protein
VPNAQDLAVTSVLAKFLAANRSTATAVYQSVLADLVKHFAVDVCFLRHNDHTIRASKLVAEWPPRSEVPDPDPLAVVFFGGPDSALALAEDAKELMVLRPRSATEVTQRRMEEARDGPPTATVFAPLVHDDITTGVLGFVTYGDREWTPEELTALEAIASVFASFQARTDAEWWLHYLAEHDEMTGLCNRRVLLAHLDSRLAAGQPTPVAALLLDVDRFKTINDYMGHAVGDLLIQTLAERLVGGIDRNDLIARFGGDEFVVVPASPMDARGAESLARRLHSLATERVKVDGEVVARTVSIGVALGMPGRDSTADLMSRADRALIIAKNSGGNQVTLYSDTPLMSDFRTDVAIRLEGAIASNSLVLHYLPEIDMRTGCILATEALVRWQHPTLGLLGPDSFIAMAESMNLAGELGRWVLRNSCAEFGRWHANGVGRNVTLRINVSPVQLVTDGFVDIVIDTLNEFDLDRGSICLEITEGVVVQDIEATLQTLNGLRQVGVQIAIDDFGTGYSVLSRLKSLPVDAMKIDQSFVRELGTNSGDLAIVRSIIALADAFGLQLVAEGVETEAAAAILLQHGCHRAQGFLLSPPVTGEVMMSLLAKGRIPLPFSRNPYG